MKCESFNQAFKTLLTAGMLTFVIPFICSCTGDLVIGAGYNKREPRSFTENVPDALAKANYIPIGQLR